MTTLSIPVNATTESMLERQVKQGIKFIMGSTYSDLNVKQIRYVPLEGKWLNLAPTGRHPLVCMVEITLEEPK